jgi:hypothetical protein
MKEGGMLLYDVEARNMIAQEHAELLRAQAEGRSGERRARRWLSEHLIAAGERLAPECAPRRQPARAA